MILRLSQHRQLIYSKPIKNAEVKVTLTTLKLKIKPNNTYPYFIFLTENRHCIIPLPIKDIDVLRILIHDSSIDAIAAQLFTSKNTVKTHVRNLYIEFETENKQELL